MTCWQDKVLFLCLLYKLVFVGQAIHDCFQNTMFRWKCLVLLFALLGNHKHGKMNMSFFFTFIYSLYSLMLPDFWEPDNFYLTFKTNKKKKKRKKAVASYIHPPQLILKNLHGSPDLSLNFFPDSVSIIILITVPVTSQWSHWDSKRYYYW